MKYITRRDKKAALAIALADGPWAGESDGAAWTLTRADLLVLLDECRDEMCRPWVGIRCSDAKDPRAVTGLRILKAAGLIYRKKSSGRWAAPEVVTEATMRAIRRV